MAAICRWVESMWQMKQSRITTGIIVARDVSNPGLKLREEKYF
jgi:hypothetical protein